MSTTIANMHRNNEQKLLADVIYVEYFFIMHIFFKYFHELFVLFQLFGKDTTVARNTHTQV
jgi:hypothetical protein